MSLLGLILNVVNMPEIAIGKGLYILQYYYIIILIIIILHYIAIHLLQHNDPQIALWVIAVCSPKSAIGAIERKGFALCYLKFNLNSFQFSLGLS